MPAGRQQSAFGQSRQKQWISTGSGPPKCFTKSTERQTTIPSAFEREHALQIGKWKRDAAFFDMLPGETTWLVAMRL